MKAQTDRELLLEIEELRAKLELAERRLKEADELAENTHARPQEET